MEHDMLRRFGCALCALAFALTALPTAAFAQLPEEQADTKQKALYLQKRLQVSYLFISHDISVVNYMADRIAVMLHGKIIEQGSPEAVLQNPRSAYTRQLLDCSFANKANRRL